MSPTELVAVAWAEADACGRDGPAHAAWPCGAGYADDEEHHDAHLAAAVAADRERVAREAGRRGWADAVKVALRGDTTIASALWPGEDAVVERLAKEGA